MNKKFDIGRIVYDSEEEKEKFLEKNRKAFSALNEQEPFIIVFTSAPHESQETPGSFEIGVSGYYNELYYSLVVVGDNLIPYPIFLEGFTGNSEPLQFSEDENCIKQYILELKFQKVFGVQFLGIVWAEGSEEHFRRDAVQTAKTITKFCLVDKMSEGPAKNKVITKFLLALKKRKDKVQKKLKTWYFTPGSWLHDAAELTVFEKAKGLVGKFIYEYPPQGMYELRHYTVDFYRTRHKKVYVFSNWLVMAEDPANDRDRIKPPLVVVPYAALREFEKYLKEHVESKELRNSSYTSFFQKLSGNKELLCEIRSPILF